MNSGHRALPHVCSQQGQCVQQYRRIIKGCLYAATQGHSLHFVFYVKSNWIELYCEATMQSHYKPCAFNAVRQCNVMLVWTNLNEKGTPWLYFQRYDVSFFSPKVKAYLGQMAWHMHLARTVLKNSNSSVWLKFDCIFDVPYRVICKMCITIHRVF